MKSLLLVFLLFITSYSSLSQPLDKIYYYYENYKIEVPWPTEDRQTHPFIVCAIPQNVRLTHLLTDKTHYTSREHSIYSSNRNVAQRIFEISGDSSMLQDMLHTRYNSPLYTFDSLGVPVFIQGINRNNAQQYEYKISQNNKEVIQDWKSPDEFINSTYITGFGDSDSNMAYVGEITSGWDTYKTIEVREKANKRIFAKQSIFWLNHSPSIAATFNNNQLNDFFKVFKLMTAETPQIIVESLNLDSLLKKDSVFQQPEYGLIFMLDNIFKKNIIEYRIESYSTSSKWEKNNFDYNFIWLKNLTPGKYKLDVRYSTQRQNVTSYRFEIMPAWYQTIAFKISIAIILIILALISAYFFRQKELKKKLLRQLELKEKKELELRSIRSQLNPHFVFNALNSIQGLVNANEKEKANQYLSDFSNMMRDTLSGNSKDYSPLETELAILDRYLKLEQLRFGFAYEIKVADSINATSIEIPTLLLQPLVENAVKHGVAQMLSKGKIAIAINMSENDLIVAIHDNGPGFANSKEHHEGFGIRLTHERIILLNQINKDNPISISFEKKSDGMVVNLIFKDIC